MQPPATSLLFYRLLSTLLFIPAVIFSILQFFKHRNWVYLQQRLGWGYPKVESSIHIHCASVGEVNTCLPLLKLISKHVAIPVVVTTNTVTGFQTISNHSIQGIQPVFLPLDYTWFVRTLFKSISPRCVIIMETELWPTLIQQCVKQQIRLWLINARISNKTLNTPAWLRDIYRQSLHSFECIVARSPSDLQALIELGAPRSRCRMMADLKYAFDENTQSPQEPLPLHSSPYLLCVSTHDDEEIRIARVWHKNSATLPRLVIAPRHPNRISAICAAFHQSQIPYYLHQGRTGDPNGIYLIDTLGELAPFLQHAETVFIGGSLVERGGHNMLEAARHKKCILIGPHYENFKDIVEALIKTEGIQVVSSAAELMEYFQYFQENTRQRNTMGEQARTLVEQNRNTHKQYYALLSEANLFTETE